MNAGINIVDAKQHVFPVYDGFLPMETGQNILVCPTANTLDLTFRITGND
jgi:hypothetical protein